MKFEPRRLFRYYYLRFRRLKGDPGSLARGAAIGAFVGAAPMMPLRTISVLFFTPICRANLVAAFTASVTVGNPLTYLPSYYFSWLIGNSLTPYDLSWQRIKEVMDIVVSDAGINEIITSLSRLGMDTIIVLLVGGFILAAPLAAAAYFLSLNFFSRRRHRNRNQDA